MIFNDIKELISVTAEPAVTIYFNTHKTFPDNSKDNIKLKNLIKETEKRLAKKYSDETITKILNKLKDFASEVNHNYNTESMAIFVTENYFNFTRLPVVVTDKVILGNKFSTKVLLRSILKIEQYFILTLSRKIVRLFEVSDRNVINEIKDENFPLENQSYIDSEDIRKAWSSTEDNYAREFFIKVNKLYKEYYKRNPMSLVLAGDIRNIAFFNEVTDLKNIIGYYEGSFDYSTPYEILISSREVIENFVKEKNKLALEEINLAVKEKKLLTDLNDIYRETLNGNCSKLFVEKNYYQPASIENNMLILRDNPDEKNTIDDIINEIIEMVIKSGGDIYFFDDGNLDKYNKIALITRY